MITPLINCLRKLVLMYTRPEKLQPLQQKVVAGGTVWYTNIALPTGKVVKYRYVIVTARRDGEYASQTSEQWEHM